MRVNALLTERLPGDIPLTRDLLKMLEHVDNVVTNDDAVQTFQLPLVPLDEQLRRARLMAGPQIVAARRARRGRRSRTPDRVRALPHRQGAPARLPGPDRERRDCPSTSSASTRSSAGRADCSHVSFFPWPREDLREHVLSQDVDLRQRREHGEHARRLARPRLRRDPPRGLGAGHRPGRLERRDDLLVRGRRHRLVRPAARRDARRARLPQPAARARTTTARSAAGPSTRSSSRTASRAGVAADDAVGAPLRRHGAARGGRGPRRRAAYRVEPGAETPIEPRSPRKRVGAAP